MKDYDLHIMAILSRRLCGDATNNLLWRVLEHKSDLASTFTARHRLTMLVGQRPSRYSLQGKSRRGCTPSGGGLGVFPSFVSFPLSIAKREGDTGSEGSWD